MEAKASRMSQRSNVGQPNAIRVGKTISKASLSPSQMSERTRLAAANKDPLDALSRAGTRQINAERRCGLQDVDDEYLKTVVYAFAKQTNQSAAERAKVTADMMPAGVPTLRTPNRTSVNAESRMPAGSEQPGSTGVVQEQLQAQMQNQMQPNQQQVSAQMQAQVQQNQSTPSQMQAKAPLTQTQAQAAPTSPAQDAVASEKQQSSQKPSATERQGGGGEPELYTTCPNCQATLYLVRNAGEPSPYRNQTGDAAPNQNQAQQQ